MPIRRSAQTFTNRHASRRIATPGIAVMTAVLLAACGGGGGDSPAPAPVPAPAPAVIRAPTAGNTSANLGLLPVAESRTTGAINASDPQGLALSYVVLQKPALGTAVVNPFTGAFTYSLAGTTTAVSDSFTVTVSNGKASAVATVTVKFGSDPLFVNQWHLKNTGASAFATALPTAGNDINVVDAWGAGVTGKGIKVAVVDSGLEMAHEDLSANVDASHSVNLLNGSNDPTVEASVSGHDHGTQVAGIIAATAFNGKGGRGVAFDSRLRGYNFLRSPLAESYAISFGNRAVSADNDVFNASFGSGGQALTPPQSATQLIYDNLATLRGGLGAVLVQSAQNSFTTNGTAPCNDARRLAVSCGDPHQEQRAGLAAAIVVGALNADGKRAFYSTTGSSLWLAAPGGVYGYDSAYADVSFDPVNAIQPAIVTTARTGCPNRQDYPAKDNGLVTGTNVLALNCQYTAQMNGTSAAAPAVSGVVALMLEANPRLSARDVKYILAKTAKKVDPTQAKVISTAILPGAVPVTLDQAWVTNAAGYAYSNAYGFGGVDASAAVNMAKSFTTSLPALRMSKVYASVAAAGLNVPPQVATGLSIPFVVSETSTSVEHVSIGLNIPSTQGLQCVQIELTSPAGTRSIVLHAATGYSQTSAIGVRMSSNAFYGEAVNGTWRLTFLNYCSGQTALSSTLPQTLQIAAH